MIAMHCGLDYHAQMYELSPETLPQRDVYSVARLNQEARELLEGGFPLLWVEGEISNLSRPASGHWYFSLKDAQAQVRCAMFRQRTSGIDFVPENGIQILVRARVSLYEGRGDFQLIIEHMEAAGDGALRRAFELLKQRLAAEGLFDPARKKPLPSLPRRIGVITSPTGAALRDILTCLRRRFPGIPVLIYPVPVQGIAAAEKIARALTLAGQRADCDVLILARGGGSLEDLWSFNEEVVARALYACPLPVVTGIGHEIDFTIADLVADQRAATPTAAAELVSPDRLEWLDALRQLGNRLTGYIKRSMAHAQQQLDWLGKRLQHPGQRLRNQAQRLDEFEQRLRHAQSNHGRHAKNRLTELVARLQSRSPLTRLREFRLMCNNHSRNLALGMTGSLAMRRTQLESLMRALDTVSPLATLGRGYALVTRLPGRELVRSARELSPGDTIEARLGQGKAHCRVDKLLND